MSVVGQANKAARKLNDALFDMTIRPYMTPNGNILGTEKILGYVCAIHDDDDPDEKLRGTVDVKEFDNYDTLVDDEGAGIHQGVLLSAINSYNKGYKIVPTLFSEVVIVRSYEQDAIREYVLMFSSVSIIQLQGTDEVNIGITEYEEVKESDDGLEKDIWELEQAESKAVTNTTWKKDSIKEEVSNKDDALNIEKKAEKMTINVGDTMMSVGKDGIKEEMSDNGDELSIEKNAEKMTVNAGNTAMSVGKGGYKLNRGSSGLKKTLNDLIDAICQLTVTTGVGPSGVPINSARFQQIKQDLTNYLE